MDLGGGALLRAAEPVTARATAVIRPEDVQVSGAPLGDGVNTYRAIIAEVLDRGATVKLWLDSHPPLRAVVLRRQWLAEGLQPGTEVRAHIPPEAVHVLPARESDEPGGGVES